MKFFNDFEEGVREQWLDEWTIKFAAGPGAVYGAEQAKIRARSRAQPQGEDQSEKFYGFYPVVARATEAEERRLCGEASELRGRD